MKNLHLQTMGIQNSIKIALDIVLLSPYFSPGHYFVDFTLFLMIYITDHSLWENVYEKET